MTAAYCAIGVCINSHCILYRYFGVQVPTGEVCVAVKRHGLARLNEPVRQVKMSDQVASRIRRMIARGELVDGDLLPAEAELIEEFGVSRPTLREALRLLEADSLVTIRRGPPGGARVTVPGPDAVANLFGMILMLSGTTIGDVWDARLTIEPPAVRRVAQTATSAVINRLDGELEAVRATLNDPGKLSKAGVRFHITLLELSGNHTLTAVIGMLSEIIERELAKSLLEIGPDSDEVRRADRRAVRSYEKVVDLIRIRDGEGAERAWREHMKSVRRFVGRSQTQDQVIDLLY